MYESEDAIAKGAARMLWGWIAKIAIVVSVFTALMVGCSWLVFS